MERESYTYLIFAGEQAEMRSLAVGAAQARYLRDVVDPLLRPLTREQYTNDVHAILGTFARYSYVLHASHVYWCVEWSPGLLVVRFAPTGAIDWCALKSPNPEFGGRTATEAELDAFDEDAPNPQYRLVFDAWDARELPLATAEQVGSWQAAMQVANEVGKTIADLDEPARQRWLEQSQQSPIYRGESAIRS